MSIAALDAADVKFIVVHCSATPPKQDLGVTDIDRMHRLRGFIKVGYHRVIKRDGTVQQGRPFHERGAHVEGYNHCSVGVCLIGGVDASKLMKPEMNFTVQQMNALTIELIALRLNYPTAAIVGHRDIPGVSKACPSFDVKALYGSM